MIYTHVVGSGALGVTSPADCLYSLRSPHSALSSISPTQQSRDIAIRRLPGRFDQRLRGVADQWPEIRATV
jgi:hypothetical protein